MLFPTVTFAVFFLIVLPVSWSLMRHQSAWRLFILAASFVFYAWWDWRFVFLLAASIVVNQTLAVAIYRTGAVAPRKALLAAAVAFDEVMTEEGPNIPWAQVKADLGWV